MSWYSFQHVVILDACPRRACSPIESPPRNGRNGDAHRMCTSAACPPSIKLQPPLDMFMQQSSAASWQPAAAASRWIRAAARPAAARAPQQQRRQLLSAPPPLPASTRLVAIMIGSNQILYSSLIVRQEMLKDDSVQHKGAVHLQGHCLIDAK